MSQPPRALLPHTQDAEFAGQLAAAIAERDPEILLRRTRTREETEAALEETSVLLTGGIEESWYDRLDDVDWVQALSAGVNHLDRDRLAAADVMLTTASGVHAEPIAQQVLGYMLLFERNLLRAVHQQRRGVWERFRGGELGGKTAGIVGCGAIGGQIARYCDAFDMEVVATKRDPSTAPSAVDTIYGPDGLDEVLATAEYLIVTCPLTEETRGLIDAAALRVLPRQAVVINVARGAVVDEAALTDALQRGHLAGAALDVFETEPLAGDSPLWDLSNVVITPHMAGSTPRYWARCADLFVDNYAAFVAGEPAAMTNRVL